MKPLQTKFSADVSEHSALSEYPRPCLVRTSYLNLNGRWDYAFTDSPDIPQQFEGTILVPFSPECALSGVNKRLEPKAFCGTGAPSPSRAPSPASASCCISARSIRLPTSILTARTPPATPAGICPFLWK